MFVSKKKPIRILRVIGNMAMGGIETSLMHILLKMDRRYFHNDFLYTEPEVESVYDEEIRELGSDIFHCPKRKFVSFGSRFNDILLRQGPYDVVHSHCHRFNGYVLRLAHKAGVPVRIAHSHSDASAVDARCGILRKCYIQAQNCLIRRHATLGLAVSKKAAASLYGCEWYRDPRWRVFYQLRDFSQFARSRADLSSSIRGALQIPKDSFVIGHVGRFHPAKNHEFLLRVFAAIAEQDRNARLLLVGDGEQRVQMEVLAKSLGVYERVVFPGVRKDVPAILMGAIDILVMPSLYEGLPMVCVEAQAAGLPCILSDSITEEAVVVDALVRRLSLGQAVSKWAEAIIDLRELKTSGRLPDLSQSLAMIRQSPFDIEAGIRNLESIYSPEGRL